MHTLTHGLVGWVVATSDPRLGRRERALVSFAAVAPDLDGLGVVPQLLTQNGPRPLLWFSEFHHLLAHNLGFALVLGALGAWRGRPRARTALWVLASVHLHFLADLVGSGGIDGEIWTIPYGLPFTGAWELAWRGQWALDAWPNFLVTGAALAITGRRAWRDGHSPLELVSARADRALVGALRLRFGEVAR